MVDPYVPFSLPEVSGDSRGSVRKGNHYRYSRLARLQTAQTLLSPHLSDTSSTLTLLWSVLGCSPSCLLMETARDMTLLGSSSYSAPKPAEICPPPKHWMFPFARRHGRKGKCFGSSRISEGQAAYPGLSLCVLGEVYRALDAVLGGSARNLRWAWASDLPCVSLIAGLDG